MTKQKIEVTIRADLTPMIEAFGKFNKAASMIRLPGSYGAFARFERARRRREDLLAMPGGAEDLGIPLPMLWSAAEFERMGEEIRKAIDPHYGRKALLFSILLLVAAIVSG